MPKPFLMYEQQLIKLRDEKHIVITDETETLCKLQQVGYYSLVSGYKHLFRIPAHWKKISLYRIYRKARN